MLVNSFDSKIGSVPNSH